MPRNDAAERERADGSARAPAPPGSAFAHLRPRDQFGAFFLLVAATFTTLSVFFSTSTRISLWLPGQLLLAFALLQWFALLHEAGHNNLFRARWLNQLTGHVAGFFAVIPFGCWTLVHGVHHHWTGWQDLDLTTAPLAPRQRSRLERAVVNCCWRLGIPLFSLLYRVNNFWNLPRLCRIFRRRRQRRRLLASTFLLVVAYALTLYLAGPFRMLQVGGLGLLLCLIMQDPLILSQHTHVPMQISHGEAVRPFPPLQQEVFTRSLRFPAWFSALVLLHMDAHELHHMYSRIPGYYLHRIDYRPVNEVHWWQWLVKARRLPGEVFLFQNRDISGSDV
jgi:acyl-lipid omega-6 desaturase (Delta-12 desaturase)